MLLNPVVLPVAILITPDKELEKLGIATKTYEKMVECKFYRISAMYPDSHDDGTTHESRSIVVSDGSEFVVPLSVEEIEMIIDENTGTFSEHMLRDIWETLLEFKRNIEGKLYNQ